MDVFRRFFCEVFIKEQWTFLLLFSFKGHDTTAVLKFIIFCSSMSQLQQCSHHYNINMYGF